MKKLLIIFLCVLITLLVAGKIFDRCYKNYWWPFFEKLDIVIKDSTYYDGIYLGDSKIHFGINPYYIDSATGLNTYNISMGGASINEINFLAQQYLSKHPAPKFAVISIGYSDLLPTVKLLDNPCYYLFYTSDSATNNVLQNLGYHTNMYAALPVLKYTAFDDFNKISIARNMKGETIAKQGGVLYKGFINNTTGAFNAANLEKYFPKDTSFDESIATLERTVNLFLEKKTVPVFVYAPATHFAEKPKAPVEIKIDTAVAQLAGKYNIEVLHYDSDTAFANDLFSDQWHLNINGTILFSQKLGADIKEIMKNKRR
jgi:hypothetical protein